MNTPKSEKAVLPPYAHGHGHPPSISHMHSDIGRSNEEPRIPPLPVLLHMHESIYIQQNASGILGLLHLLPGKSPPGLGLACPGATRTCHGKLTWGVWVHVTFKRPSRPKYHSKSQRSMEISPWGLVIFSCLDCDVRDSSEVS